MRNTKLYRLPREKSSIYPLFKRSEEVSYYFITLALGILNFLYNSVFLGDTSFKIPWSVRNYTHKISTAHQPKYDLINDYTNRCANMYVEKTHEATFLYIELQINK